MPEVQYPFPGCEYKTADLDVPNIAALITSHSVVYTAAPVAPAAVPPAALAKVERVRRPTITAAGTSEDWAYFQSRWSDYVDATKVDGRDKVIQLLECCDEPLRKDLTRSAGGSLKDKTEAEVLAAIRKLAVREENTMVARVTLHNMRQDRDETVRSFGARLRGQADICKFVIPCPGCDANVNYTDAIMRDVLSRGIADPEIQLDLLGDKNQDMTLEEVFQFVETKEAGKRSASRLLDVHSVEAASSYKRTKQTSSKADPDICSYCGKRGHGKKSTARIRKTQCPAYDHKCELCNREHHFENVCRSKDNIKRTSRLQATRPHAHESAVFDALCTLSDHSMNKQKLNTSDEVYTPIDRDKSNASDKVCSVRKSDHNVPIDHHVYNSLTDSWIRQNSKPQPFVNVTVRTLPADYTAFGLDSKVRPCTAVIPAMADTGCQSCLAGLKVIHRLGLRESDLIPVTMRMHSYLRVKTVTWKTYMSM